MSDKRKHPVLLVDDEPEILFSLTGLLRREFELHTAESAKQALEILRQHPIHVVMTDQRMPEMTGVELLGRVRTEYPRAIRIVFTGYADIKAVIDAVNDGGLFRYITKPWDPDELIEVLHAAAGAYEAAEERQQLLREMRSHVGQSQQLARLLEHLPAERRPESSELEQFASRGQSLLERLSRLLARVILCRREPTRDGERARATGRLARDCNAALVRGGCPAGGNCSAADAVRSREPRSVPGGFAGRAGEFPATSFFRSAPARL